MVQAQKVKVQNFMYPLKDVEALNPKNTGGKGSGLAKIYRAVIKLKKAGLPVDVSSALVLTPRFIECVLKLNPKIRDEVLKLEEKLKTEGDFSVHTRKIREMIENITFTPELLSIINNAIKILRKEGKRVGKSEPIRISVRSSGLAEDLPTASFAGQYETVLNVCLEKLLVANAVLQCLESIWGDRVTDYRQKIRKQGLNIPAESEIFERGLFSVVFQIMVDAEFSGVGFSIETESGHQNVFKSTVQRGLGELGVQGKVPTAEIFAARATDVKKSKLFGKVIETTVKPLGVMPPTKPQGEMMIWDPKKGNVLVPVDAENPKIVNEEQAHLISYVISYLQDLEGKPVDVEFAWEKDKLYLLQARPETVHAAKVEAIIENYMLEKEPAKDRLVGVGLNVGTKISAGPLMPLIFGEISGEVLTRRIKLLKNMLTKLVDKFGWKPMLFTEITSPPWEPIIKRNLVSGIVTVLGNRTSHPAIISREEGLACSVGTKQLLENLDKMKSIAWGVACADCEHVVIGSSDEDYPSTCPKCGSQLFTVDIKDYVTLDCSKGEARIYNGCHNYRVETIQLKELPKAKTGVAVNCGSPMEALTVSQIPGVCKVGLAREEFIAAWIQIHPTFCVRVEKNRREGGFWTKEVEELFPGGASPKEEWVDRLTLGMGLIGAAFYPREVILRFSDFKTNEYETLTGATYYELECEHCGKGIALKTYDKCPKCGKEIASHKVDLEPKEANPMIGWRGVSRYHDPRFYESFMMEVESMIRCHKKGLTNVIPMFPFVRHPDEVKDMVDVVKARFLDEKIKAPKIIFMAEVPSVGFVPYLFNPLCDGYSFGTNDYTQLITGTDRDSPLLPFDEDIPAVRMAIAMVCDSAHKDKPPKEIGVCGQAPSDLPGFLRFLSVYLDYVSVNPDAIIKTLKKLEEAEDDLKKLINRTKKDTKKIAFELSKEFNLWNPFNPSEPAVTNFRVKWLIKKLKMN